MCVFKCATMRRRAAHLSRSRARCMLLHRVKGRALTTGSEGNSGVDPVWITFNVINFWRIICRRKWGHMCLYTIHKINGMISTATFFSQANWCFSLSIEVHTKKFFLVIFSREKTIYLKINCQIKIALRGCCKVG